MKRGIVCLFVPVHMRTHLITRRGILQLLFLAYAITGPIAAQTKPWITAYLGGWNQGNADNGYLPATSIDFSSISVVAHMAVLPRSDGTLDSVSNRINPINSSSLISTAHAAGAKVVVTVGAWATESNFLGATGSSNLSGFVNNIASFVKERGYDGVDIDWEPLSNGDASQYEAFIEALRQALPPPQYIITTTAGWGYAYAAYSAIQQYVDQINIMTYDLSWASPGYNTWYNGAVYSDSVKVPGNGLPTPSCDYLVGLFEAAGVQPGKLGISAELGGFVWKGGIAPDGKGITGPDQAWSTAPSVISDVPLYTANGTGILQEYYSSQNYHWDAGAEASYLSIQSSNPANDYFVSYDDSNSIAAKLAYVERSKLGGLMLYELGMGYPGGGSYPLLSSLKEDVDQVLSGATNILPHLVWPLNGASGITSPVSLEWISMIPLLSYRVQVATDAGFSSIVLDQSNVGADTLRLPALQNGQSYFWRVGTGLPPLLTFWSPTSTFQTGTSSGIHPPSGSGVLTSLSLYQNYPNPFNPSTTIEFAISNSGVATLRIYNILGQDVADVVDGYLPAGFYSVKWNASGLASGVYAYELDFGSVHISKKMLLVK